METSRIVQITAAPPGWRVGDDYGKKGAFKWQVRNVIAWALVEYTDMTTGEHYQQVDAVDDCADLHALENGGLYAPGELTDEEERDRL